MAGPATRYARQLLQSTAATAFPPLAGARAERALRCGRCDSAGGFPLKSGAQRPALPILHLLHQHHCLACTTYETSPLAQPPPRPPPAIPSPPPISCALGWASGCVREGSGFRRSLWRPARSQPRAARPPGRSLSRVCTSRVRPVSTLSLGRAATFKQRGACAPPARRRAPRRPAACLPPSPSPTPL